MKTILIDNDLDNAPSPIPEEELVSLNEFKEYFEKQIFEKMGLTISL
jgi:hypothetical protein